MAGDGYCTEILSRVVGKDGAIYCQYPEIPLRVLAEKPLTARLADDHFSNAVRLNSEFEDSSLTLELREVCLHLLC
jgi:predicted methyltransferase